MPSLVFRPVVLLKHPLALTATRPIGRETEEDFVPALNRIYHGRATLRA